MHEQFKFADLITIIGFAITFLIPEKFLLSVMKIILFLILVILFLIYKLWYINKSNNNKYNTINSKYDDLKSKHTELSKLFDERINTIDDLKNKINDYNRMTFFLEQSLSTAIITKDENKELLVSLMNLILAYRKNMEVTNNGK